MKNSLNNSMKSSLTRYLIASVLLFSGFPVSAANEIKFNFVDQSLTKIVEEYSKASGQNFVVDPGVRGKATILVKGNISLQEAFNHLSSALAMNGYAISKQENTMVIKSARNIQRDLIDVTSEMPALKPERMHTWIYQAKNLSVSMLNRDLRIMSSKDGEMSALSATNQLIFSDWTSNLHRIAKILEALDKPVDPAIAKLGATKDMECGMKCMEKMKKKPKENKEEQENKEQEEPHH